MGGHLHPSWTRQVTPVRVCVMSRLSFAAVQTREVRLFGAAMLHSPVRLHITKCQLCYLCPSFHVMRAYRGSGGRLRLKCDGTRAETIFRLSPKRTSI